MAMFSDPHTIAPLPQNATRVHMLSYQHIYHAGNLADVHKHALLAWIISYMTRKEKPLSYLETHAGRGLYDLTSDAALKTGEAAQGIVKHADWFAKDHPYAQVLDAVRALHGPNAYPGSPTIAAELLRDQDDITLAELHPAEADALGDAMINYAAQVKQQDGFELAMSRTPPTPRRGLLICDPSFEVKSDYENIPDFFAKIHRRWAVGVLVLWYPILTSGAHVNMIRALKSAIPDGIAHEVSFPPARPGHGMIGSGLFVVNAPYGFAEEAGRLLGQFKKL